MPKQPTDRKPKRLSHGGDAVRSAIQEHSALIVQKAMLDSLMIKMVEVMRTVQTVKSGRSDEEDKGTLTDWIKEANAIDKIDELLHLTRAQTEELRQSPESVYPLAEMHPIVEQAVERMTEVLIGGQ